MRHEFDLSLSRDVILIPNMPFSIGGPLEPSFYLSPFPSISATVSTVG